MFETNINIENMEIIPYVPEEKDIVIDVRFDGTEGFWMNQQQLSETYNREITVIRKHIKNIYDSKELDEKVTSAKFALVQMEGTREIKREINYYNYDMILAIGYRVNSKEGVRFRNNVSKIVKERTLYGIPQLTTVISNIQLEMKDLKESNQNLHVMMGKMVTSYRIDEEEKYMLNQLAKERVIDLFEQPYINIDKVHYRIAVAALWRDFKEYFKISKYAMLPKIEWDNALEFVRNWNDIPYNRFPSSDKRAKCKKMRKDLYNEIEKMTNKEEVISLAENVLLKWI
jgi:hypothetical protein